MPVRDESWQTSYTTALLFLLLFLDLSLQSRSLGLGTWGPESWNLVVCIRGRFSRMVAASTSLSDMLGSLMRRGLEYASIPRWSAVPINANRASVRFWPRMAENASAASFVLFISTQPEGCRFWAWSRCPTRLGVGSSSVAACLRAADGNVPARMPCASLDMEASTRKSLNSALAKLML